MSGAGGGELLLLIRRFRLAVLLLVSAIAYGTAGFVVLERWSVLDALYMTLMTLTTVGFGEVRTLSASGRVFTITLMVFGVITVFAIIGIVAQLIVTGDIAEPLRRRRMRHRIEDLTNHFVVCAYGRVGRAAARELRSEGVPFVVAELKEELVGRMEADGLLYISGDPTSEVVLRRAGIERARGLICAVDSDAGNVYITLTARALNPPLYIVGRASDPESVANLRRAGADRVVSPYSLSGTRMASLALRPAVVDFVDMVTLAPDLRLEEIIVRQGSAMDGTTVDGVRHKHAELFVLAVKRSGGDLVASPPGDLLLRIGDLVVALGPVSALAALEA